MDMQITLAKFAAGVSLELAICALWIVSTVFADSFGNCAFESIWCLSDNYFMDLGRATSVLMIIPSILFLISMVMVEVYGFRPRRVRSRMRRGVIFLGLPNQGYNEDYTFVGEQNKKKDSKFSERKIQSITF
ncbi:uncharacterized protein RJT20DRAFT_135538 [Scheffersomyces xylosifermentans]|uniref:uncharacterized protein n=1 Tax=Scheffersomyces xylosifermentans TaxID=1304137 RepID=UPI00315C628D